MIPSRKAFQGNAIQAFLAVSRTHFELAGYTSNANQRTSVSVAASAAQKNHLRFYRRAVQSLLLAVGVGSFVAGPAMADPGCGPMAMGGNPEHHAKMMEQHHLQLHNALKLSAEQEPAWKKLMESEQPKSAPGDAQAIDWSKLNAPERAEKRLELSKLRQAQMGEHVIALKVFYAVLTPEQQKTFEEFHAGPRGRMPGKPIAKSSSKP